MMWPIGGLVSSRPSDSAQHHEAASRIVAPGVGNHQILAYESGGMDRHPTLADARKKRGCQRRAWRDMSIFTGLIGVNSSLICFFGEPSAMLKMNLGMLAIMVVSGIGLAIGLAIRDRRLSTVLLAAMPILAAWVSNLIVENTVWERCKGVDALHSKAVRAMAASVAEARDEGEVPVPLKDEQVREALDALLFFRCGCSSSFNLWYGNAHIDELMWSELPASEVLEQRRLQQEEYGAGPGVDFIGPFAVDLEVPAPVADQPRVVAMSALLRGVAGVGGTEALYVGYDDGRVVKQAFTPEAAEAVLAEMGVGSEAFVAWLWRQTAE